MSNISLILNPVVNPSTLLPLRERIRRWIRHIPDSDGRYEGFRAVFSDLLPPMAVNDVSGEEFVFEQSELDQE